MVPSLSRFYSDVQELLLSAPEFQHVGRLWRELNAMSSFMDALRSRPDMLSGQCFTAVPLLRIITAEFLKFYQIPVIC